MPWTSLNRGHENPSTIGLARVPTCTAATGIMKKSVMAANAAHSTRPLRRRSRPVMRRLAHSSSKGAGAPSTTHASTSLACSEQDDTDWDVRVLWQVGCERLTANRQTVGNEEACVHSRKRHDSSWVPAQPHPAEGLPELLLEGDEG